MTELRVIVPERIRGGVAGHGFNRRWGGGLTDVLVTAGNVHLSNLPNLISCVHIKPQMKTECVLMQHFRGKTCHEFAF